MKCGCQSITEFLPSAIAESFLRFEVRVLAYCWFSTLGRAKNEVWMKIVVAMDQKRK